MSKLAHAGASSTVPPGGAAPARRGPPPPSTPPRRPRACRRAPAGSPGRASPMAIDRRRPPVQRGPQVAQVAALEAAADDRHEPALEALDRPPRRLDVGRLRVVDERGCRQSPSTGSSACSRPPNSDTALRIASGDAPARRRDRRGGRDVGQQVTPNQPHLVHRQQRHVVAARGALDDPAVRQHGPVGQLRLDARTAAAARAHACAARFIAGAVVGVDHHPVALALVREDPAPSPRRTRWKFACRSRWSAERFEQRRDPRVERRRRLQLEAAHLHDVDRLGGRRRRPSAASGAPMLPATRGRQPRFRQHPARRASSSSTSPSCR